MEAAEYARTDEIENRLWWFRGLHRIILDRMLAVKAGPATRVLDAGCGTGGLLCFLEDRELELKIFGFDSDELALVAARRKSRSPLARANINTLPYRTDSFDVILSIDVLYHRAVDEPKALEEILRCLKPGGKLLVHLPAYDWLMSAHDSNVHTRTRYTATSCRAMLNMAGFEVSHVSYWNSLLFPFLVAHRLTVGKLKSTSDLDLPPKWQDDLFFWIIEAERRLARRGITLPFGSSVSAVATKPVPGL